MMFRRKLPSKFYLPPAVVKTPQDEYIGVLKENCDAYEKLQNKNSDARVTFQTFLENTNLVSVAVEYLRRKTPEFYWEYVMQEKFIRYQAFIIYKAYMLAKRLYLRPLLRDHCDLDVFKTKWKVICPSIKSLKCL